MSTPSNPKLFDTRLPEWMPPDSRAFVRTELSLRDLFAAFAMTGMLATYPPGSSVQAADLATDAIALADAMLAAREAQS